MTVDSPWEDNLLERKVESDLKDLPKTLVAFANSVRPGNTAVILIGETDENTVQGVANPDNIQKKVREECDKIYPPILWRSRVYEKDGKHCVRIEIEYNGETPHFGGAAWVRKGSETIKATEEIFQNLIAYRTGIVRELAKWEGKNISLLGERTAHGQHPRWGANTMTVGLTEVNSFFITVNNGANFAEPIEKLALSWDHNNKRLLVLVKW